MRQLRIGIDIHSIGSQAGGNETYYRELVRELLKCKSDHRFFFYYSHSTAVQQVQSGDNCDLKRLVPSQRLIRIPFTIPWQTRVDRLDVFHAQFIVPPFLKCKTVTTIPDIAFERYPQFFPAHQRSCLKVLVRESARKADHIITVSEHSKKDLIQLYGIPSEKITVTYEGAGEQFMQLDKVECRERVARKFGVDDTFILYVGRLQARKNLARVVHAYANVRKAGFPHKLILVGKHDSLFAPVLSRIRDMRLEKDVALLGYVDSTDLPALYNAADIFVYPSLYEGFGLPVMEAMACGTPVVTSQGCCLEEIAGDAAMLVDPLDELSIANAMKQVLAAPELCKQLGRAGLARSARFSFQNAARETIQVYQRVMGIDRIAASSVVSPRHRVN